MVKGQHAVKTGPLRNVQASSQVKSENDDEKAVVEVCFYCTTSISLYHYIIIPSISLYLLVNSAMIQNLLPYLLFCSGLLCALNCSNKFSPFPD